MKDVIKTEGAKELGQSLIEKVDPKEAGKLAGFALFVGALMWAYDKWMDKM